MPKLDGKPINKCGECSNKRMFPPAPRGQTQQIQFYCDKQRTKLMALKDCNTIDPDTIDKDCPLEDVEVIDCKGITPLFLDEEFICNASLGFRKRIEVKDIEKFIIVKKGRKGA